MSEMRTDCDEMMNDAHALLHAVSGSSSSNAQLLLMLMLMMLMSIPAD